MEAECSIQVGQVDGFTLTAADYGIGISFRAIAVYSQTPRALGALGVSGWRFVDLTDELRTLLVGMLIMAVDDTRGDWPARRHRAKR
jgi:hypothetical protein